MSQIDQTELLRRIYNAISWSEPCFHLTRESSRRDTGIRIMNDLKILFGGKREEPREELPAERMVPHTVVGQAMSHTVPVPESPLPKAIRELPASTGTVIVITDGEGKDGTPTDVVKSAETVLDLLRERGLWMGKADILGRTGIPESHWPQVTAYLIGRQEVQRQGERRHAKYKATK
jgi:hypothetical protein